MAIKPAGYSGGMERNMKSAAALVLSLLLAGEPGAAAFTPAALPPGGAALAFGTTHLPPVAMTPPPPVPASQIEPLTRAAPRTLVLPPAPEAPAPEAPATEAAPTPAPSALPADARLPRKERLTGRRLQMSAGVTAELLKDEGARDGFRRMRVGDSEGPMLQYTAPRVEPVDPLVIDLDGDGLRTRARRVVFDIDGDGKRDSVNDIDRGDGLLVFDADGDGRAGEDGGELLGDRARLGDAGKLPDGFTALEALVAKAADAGLLSPEVGVKNRLSREDIVALEDSWGLRVRLGGLKGRDRRLSDIGIVRLDLGTGAQARHEDYDGRGNALTAAEGAEVVMMDGTRRAYGELWLSPKTGQLSPLAR